MSQAAKSTSAHTTRAPVTKTSVIPEPRARSETYRQCSFGEGKIVTRNVTIRKNWHATNTTITLVNTVTKITRFFRLIRNSDTPKASSRTSGMKKKTLRRTTRTGGGEGGGEPTCHNASSL